VNVDHHERRDEPMKLITQSADAFLFGRRTYEASA
jgi:hypothetical protein